MELKIVSIKDSNLIIPYDIPKTRYSHEPREILTK